MSVHPHHFTKTFSVLNTSSFTNNSTKLELQIKIDLTNPQPSGHPEDELL